MRTPISSRDQLPLLAGVEAGGTKIVCAVARTPDEVLREYRFPTEEPGVTLDEIASFFREAQEEYGQIGAMGIGSFGPVDLRESSDTYGQILRTPKEGWEGTDILAGLRQRIGGGFPVCLDTDVNAAAIGEAGYGAAKGKRHVAYVTVGTGIGAGMLLDGKPLHGALHTEVGHMSVPNLDEGFGKNTSVCPFHDSCLEGRASGPAIQKRWGMPGAELPDGHEAWELEASYLAHAIMNLTAMWSPEVVILGGGVMQKKRLIEMVREKFAGIAGGYWSLPPLGEYILAPGLGQQAGIIGALALAGRSRV